MLLEASALCEEKTENVPSQGKRFHRSAEVKCVLQDNAGDNVNWLQWAKCGCSTHPRRSALDDMRKYKTGIPTLRVV